METKSESEKTYYIASVECYEVRAYDGLILTHDGERVWLGTDQGFSQCFRGESSAKHFKHPDDFDVKNWDGMPWNYRLKPGTLEITKVTEVKTLCKEKVKINVGD